MAERLDDLAAAMRDLTQALEQDDQEHVVFSAICAEAVRAIPDADLASITAIHKGRAETAASTDPRADQVDAAQYAIGNGPCLRAATTGEVVRLSVPAAEEAWPDFVAAAKKVGVGSYLAAPLRVDDTISGALNLFGFGDNGFRTLESHLLTVYTTVVEFGLRTTQRYREARVRADQLDLAMSSRSVIEQAKGMLMAIHRIDADAAMQRLITESQTTNTKLREVARRFVDTVSGRG
ncbi:GAF and ANTAR domain-containing protein [Amycolatopsis jiangsuensis]|uniref:Transcriptional regulator with GAF, ATPase, and Fis domain n=1 Tax=Amycolatopsis jiangsuensis TaxID=1181879 RepID=A0A840IRM6_9PSEU|nr:GAF and ANTAR domain-containing protein [Amycolatopsis jiangsuensis]MBB4685046.1 transcriptional regulator with GAF, ATPase, and Fis domain [Amycolatopsis jiangsuensis]